MFAQPAEARDEAEARRDEDRRGRRFIVPAGANVTGTPEVMA